MSRILALIAVLAVAACGDDAPKKSLPEVAKSVTGVATDNGWLQVRYRAAGYDAGEGDMAIIAHDLIRIGKWQMQTGGGVDKGLVLTVDVPTKDAYGNAGSVEALGLSLTGDDLRRINWENFTHWDLANLTRLDLRHKFGQDLVVAWCSEQDNLKYSARFCRQLLTTKLFMN